MALGNTIRLRVEFRVLVLLMPRRSKSNATKNNVENPFLRPRRLSRLARSEGLQSVFSSGGIRTIIGRCSYYDTFEWEWLSYSLIWAAPTKYTVVQAYIF
jgi:hypothetical protein